MNQDEMTEDDIRESGLRGSLLAITMSAMVPLMIAGMERRGGPESWEWEAAHDYADILASKGDVLMCGGKPGTAARLASGLARALAVMAFVPGGVRFCGSHYEAKVVTHA